MSKSAKKRNVGQAEVAEEARTVELAEYLRWNLMEFVVREGLKALDVMLEQDREGLCGPAYAKGGVSDPRRWGSTEGVLVMGGRRIGVRRPRVRQEGHEVELPTWAAFADEDPLDERMFEQLVLGVSTRNYEQSLDELPPEVPSRGTARSSASRRFARQAQKQVDAWLKQDLSALSLAVVMLDGIHIGEHTVVVALGIDSAGAKHPLGVWLGETENATVCGALLDNLVDRGLDPLGAYLFVIDGSKALRKAVQARFGSRGRVQRCQQHKRTNVLNHLPRTLKRSVSKALLDAYNAKTVQQAKRRLNDLAISLEDDHPDAAASLREGLEETLTVKSMNLPAALERSLRTTNAIENLNGTIRTITRRVKRWRDGAMAKRWTVAALMQAEKGFHRIKGHKGMNRLLVALSKYTTSQQNLDEQHHAA